MGNRAVITTKNDMERNGIGLYMHWNGGYDSVRPILDYCRIRGFRTPDESDYGYARLAQVVSNMMGGDGYSVGIGPLDSLDTDNGDNGTYVVEGWKVVERLYFSGEEQNMYDYGEFMKFVDESQPEWQKIGTAMMSRLLEHGRTLPEVSFQYHFSMERRAGMNIRPEGFKVGASYACLPGPDESRLLVTGITMDGLTGEYRGRTVSGPRFPWKDGAETFVLTDDDGNERIVDSAGLIRRGSCPPGLVERPVPEHLRAVLGRDGVRSLAERVQELRLALLGTPPGGLVDGALETGVVRYAVVLGVLMREETQDDVILYPPVMGIGHEEGADRAARDACELELGFEILVVHVYRIHVDRHGMAVLRFYIDYAEGAVACGRHVRRCLVHVRRIPVRGNNKYRIPMEASCPEYANTPASRKPG